MVTLDTTYDIEELGYKTKPVVLDGDIDLAVELSTDGYVVVKQLDEDTDTYHNVLVSSYCTKSKSRVYGHTWGKTIQVFASVSPKSIAYENI